MKQPDPLHYEFFEVVGAGTLAVSRDADWSCGGIRGVSLRPSWTAYGYSGGVMNRKEMRRLRDHLNKLLNDEYPPPNAQLCGRLREKKVRKE